jgi:hypothetical protein
MSVRVQRDDLPLLFDQRQPGVGCPLGDVVGDRGRYSQPGVPRLVPVVAEVFIDEVDHHRSRGRAVPALHRPRAGRTAA